MEPLDPAAFEFAAHIRYSETTHEGVMSLPALIEIFQDCSIFHSEKIGYGPERLKAAHKAWVLTHWHVVVDRYPRLNELVTVGTYANRFKTVSAGRNFYLRDADGFLIARANSSWGFIDLVAGKPVRPSADHIDAYRMGTPLDMPSEDRRIAMPESLEPGEPLTVRRDLIDTNEHVNNSQYVRIALGALPGEVQAKRLRVDYRRSATLDDAIVPHVALEPDRAVVALRDGEGATYGVVEFS